MILPGRIVYDKKILSLVVPAELGYLGVLAHHAPIIARLVPGKITLRSDEDAMVDFILTGNGLLEFSDNRATLLVDSLELPA